MAKKKGRSRNQVQPERLTQESSSRQYVLNTASLYPSFGNEKKKHLISDRRRKTLAEVRSLANTLAGYTAINKVTNAVLQMQWSIKTPVGLGDDDAAKEICRRMTTALRRPNAERMGRFRHFAAILVDELLTANIAYVERQPGDLERIFWLFSGNAAQIRENPRWTPQNSGITPRYLQSGDNAAIMDENMFAIINNANAHELIPRSPMEIAHGFIEAWLGLSDFQTITTSEASQKWILDIGSISKPELDAFREYWKVEVQGNKRMPIVNAAGQLKTVKIGANADEGLYLKYTEYLLKLIALAFGLSGRDFNLTDHDNRATAGVSADASFASAALPIARSIFEALQDEVVDFYAPGFILSVDYSEPRSEAERLKNSREDFTAGIISLNEARQIRGLPEEPEDRYFVRQSVESK